MHVMSKGRHGTGGVWREGGEEERGRRGRGLCLRAPSRGLSGTLLALVGCLSKASRQSFRGPLSAQSCGSAPWTTITGKDGDDSQRVNRSIVSFKRVVLTVIIVMCGLFCVRSTQKNHIQKKNQKCKMSYCSANHTFRTYHAALDASTCTAATPDPSLPPGRPKI